RKVSALVSGVFVSARRTVHAGLLPREVADVWFTMANGMYGAPGISSNNEGGAMFFCIPVQCISKGAAKASVVIMIPQLLQALLLDSFLLSPVNISHQILPTHRLNPVLPSSRISGNSIIILCHICPKSAGCPPVRQIDSRNKLICDTRPMTKARNPLTGHEKQSSADRGEPRQAAGVVAATDVRFWG